MNVPEAVWSQLKSCRIHMELKEILDTGNELLNLQNPVIIHGFLYITADLLKEASQTELLQALSKMDVQVTNTELPSNDPIPSSLNAHTMEPEVNPIK